MAKQKVRSRRARLETERKARQRKKRIVVGGIITAAVIIGIGAVVLTSPGEGSVPVAMETGPAAPEFELPAVSGEPVSLSDYRGRPVALTFMHSW